MNKARVYSRASIVRAGEKSVSVERQKNMAEKKAEELGLTQIEHYSDEGFSGGSTNRPEYQRLCQDMQPEDTVIVYDLDRISRDTVDLLNFVKQVRLLGVRLVSLSENYDESPEGKFMLTVKAGGSQWYRDVAVKRSRLAMIHKVEKGEFCGGQAPYGYDIVGRKEDAHLIINETEKDILCQMFDRFEKKPSYRGIARWLNENNIKTKGSNKGKRPPTTFASGTVKRILSNPICMGIQTYGKRPASKKFVSKDKWLYKEANINSIISKEQFDRVQKIIANRPRTEKKRKYNAVFVLDGIMRCECGASLNGYTQRKPNGKLYFYYKCHNYTAKGSSVCRRPALVKSEIEQEILKNISEQVKLQFEESEAREIKEDSPVEILARTERHIYGLKAKQKKWLDLYEDGSIDKVLLIKRMNDITLQIEQVEDSRQKLLQETNPENKAKRHTLMDKVNAGWDGMTDSDKKRILKQLVKSLKVNYNGEAELELYEI